MNKRHKLLLAQYLDDEEEVIRRLKAIYGRSMADILAKIAVLDSSIAELQKALKDVTADEIGDFALAVLGGKAHYTPDEAKETLRSMLQSKVYQKQYQKAMGKQVGDILEQMHKQQFDTVAEYLDLCYENGWVGALYEIMGQGVPFAMPLDQEAMVRAVQLDSKISEGLYTRLGQDIATLKQRIMEEVSRNISSGMTFHQLAQQLAAKTGIGYTNAIRIARTEGHRIQCQATMDACYKAQDMGANVVKQWDSTLDGRTRPSHVLIDGEVRELHEKFSNGLRFPGDPNGPAHEVINCRCSLLERARWALAAGFTKMNNFTKQLETFKTPEAYKDFKAVFFSPENRRYMNYVESMMEKYGTKNFNAVLAAMTEREYKHYSKLLSSNPIFKAKGSET